MIIRLKVFEQTLSIVDTKSVPRKGSKDYLVLQFTFSSDWKDLNKVCYLQRGDVSQPIDVVDGLVEVPEWFTEQDSFDVTLFGKGSTQEVPTNVVSLRLEKSNTLWEQAAPEPQPSWLAKVIDLNSHPPVPGDNGYWMLWDTDSGAYVKSEFPLPSGGSGGTSDHSKLINRDNADQHPMSAVTGLVEALNGKQPKGDYLTQDNLQSATNAALAQAKASGEFDGTDGITPNIGDNGNWYLGATDTGKPSRGEKGDPGDTPDMTAYRTAEAQNVIDAGKQNTLIQSGATVGQIAKITAVDGSGKPTAWEAVEFPNGLPTPTDSDVGKVLIAWEGGTAGWGNADSDIKLIYSNVLTKAVSSIIIDKGPNGNALSLSRWKVCLRIPPEFADYSTPIYMYCVDGDNNGFVVPEGNIATNDISARNVVIYESFSDHIVRGFFHKYGSAIAKTDCIYYVNGVNSTAINLHTYSADKPFPVGTFVEVYGK